MNKVDLLLFDVAVRHAVSIDGIKGTSRVSALVQARHEFCVRAKGELGMSLHMIGKAINRSAATVHAAINKRGAHDEH